MGGLPALDCIGSPQDDDGNSFYDRYVLVQDGDAFVSLDYIIHDSYMDEAVPLFQSILDSVTFGTAQ